MSRTINARGVRKKAGLNPSHIDRRFLHNGHHIDCGSAGHYVAVILPRQTRGAPVTPPVQYAGDVTSKDQALEP